MRAQVAVGVCIYARAVRVYAFVYEYTSSYSFRSMDSRSYIARAYLCVCAKPYNLMLAFLCEEQGII